MSHQRNKSTQPPPRWLHCPRKANQLVMNKFLAFKTPLSSNYDESVPEACRWDVSWVFDYCKGQRKTMGLWIDLTNTDRFYDKQNVEKEGCKYLKLSCRGHGETPSVEQTQTFVRICQNFIRQNPLQLIGVHCTHGFNRTGFLICSFLIEDCAYPADKALKDFADVRPPGIYKEDYIEELFKRYDDPDDWEYFSQNIHPPPSRPAWCLEDEYEEESQEDAYAESSQSDGPPRKKRRREKIIKSPVFMAGVQGVSPVSDFAKMSGIQKKIQDICGWNDSGFPGSQPVSMDMQNLKLLKEKPYMVSWKADGTRYMMLITGGGEVYFTDRNHSIFQVNGLTFPYVRELTKKLQDTLLDGEMVIDKENGREYPRYLVYDVIMYNGKDVSRYEFYPARYNIIEREIIQARTEAMKKGLIRREQEPFSVRLKTFWEISNAHKLLSEKFMKQLSHEPDGLIFQPSKDPYTVGTCPEVLKWKPESHNSVDFKLQIATESGEGLVPRKIGQLYVGGLDRPFAVMKATKTLKELDKKIIECKIENGQWVFMRERTDKSLPNSYKTAMSVCNSIRNPVTKEILLTFIDRVLSASRKQDMKLMPPPPMGHHH